MNGSEVETRTGSPRGSPVSSLCDSIKLCRLSVCLFVDCSVFIAIRMMVISSTGQCPVVIAIMQWPNHTILVLLVVEIQALLSYHQPPCSSVLFDFHCQYSSYEGLTKILTTQSWSLSYTDAYTSKLTVLAQLWALWLHVCFVFPLAAIVDSIDWAWSSCDVR